MNVIITISMNQVMEVWSAALTWYAALAVPKSKCFGNELRATLGSLT